MWWGDLPDRAHKLMSVMAGLPRLLFEGGVGAALQRVGNSTQLLHERSPVAVLSPMFPQSYPNPFTGQAAACATLAAEAEGSLRSIGVVCERVAVLAGGVDAGVPCASPGPREKIQERQAA